MIKIKPKYNNTNRKNMTNLNNNTNSKCTRRSDID